MYSDIDIYWGSIEKYTAFNEYGFEIFRDRYTQDNWQLNR